MPRVMVRIPTIWLRERPAQEWVSGQSAKRDTALAPDQGLPWPFRAITRGRSKPGHLAGLHDAQLGGLAADRLRDVPRAGNEGTRQALHGYAVGDERQETPDRADPEHHRARCALVQGQEDQNDDQPGRDWHAPPDPGIHGPQRDTQNRILLSFTEG